MSVTIHASDIETLPGIGPHPCLRFRVPAASHPERRSERFRHPGAAYARSSSRHFEMRASTSRFVFDVVPHDRRSGAATIGEGDRFEGGARPPGGSAPARGEPRRSRRIMNVDEIGSAITGLVNEYGIPTFDPPNATAEGAGDAAGRSATSTRRPLPRLLHRRRARPRARRARQPDLLHRRSALRPEASASASRTANVLLQRRRHHGAQHRHRLLPAGQPRRRPLGPGRPTPSWRKNRNPASAIPGNAARSASTSTATTTSSGTTAATSTPRRRLRQPRLRQPALRHLPRHGPFSEPETRNVAWVLRHVPAASAGTWTSTRTAATCSTPGATTSTSRATPARTFRNPGWDGQRGVARPRRLPGVDHRGGLAAPPGVARRVTGRDAQRSAAGPIGRCRPSASTPPPAPATTTPSAASRPTRSRNKVYGFTLEFGYPTTSTRPSPSSTRTSSTSAPASWSSASPRRHRPRVNAARFARRDRTAEPRLNRRRGGRASTGGAWHCRSVAAGHQLVSAWRRARARGHARPVQRSGFGRQQSEAMVRRLVTGVIKPKSAFG